MNTSQTWQDLFQSEIEHAGAARASGNEGMARVCARRAAGIVIGEYFRRSGTVDPGPSAYDRLRFLAQLEGTPAAVRSVCEHFTTRIDKDFNLPLQVDLIADALWIAQTLLGYAKPTI